MRSFRIIEPATGVAPTALEVLRRARNTLADEGRWTQGAMVTGLAPCGDWKVCATGAIAMHCGLLGRVESLDPARFDYSDSWVTENGDLMFSTMPAPVVHSPTLAERIQLYKDALNLINRFAWQSLYRINDDAAHVNDVLDIFDKAIADADQ